MTPRKALAALGVAMAAFVVLAPPAARAAACLLDTSADGTATDGIDTAGGTVASGVGATACGATALGQRATAGFANSMALGAGVATTAANQAMLGAASNTYTLPGIGSTASLAAQTGPVQLVTTDAAGNLATDGGAAFAGVQGLMRDVRTNREGVAIALDAPFVPPGQVVSFSGAYANFEGAGALAFSGAIRVHENVQVDAGFGYGLRERSLGGRIGVSIGW